jgi:hypothetical protein
VKKSSQGPLRRRGRVAAIEHPPWQLQTVLELIDPPDGLRIGSTFSWKAINNMVRITRLAPPHCRPSTPTGILICVELVIPTDKRRRQAARTSRTVQAAKAARRPQGGE